MTEDQFWRDFSGRLTFDTSSVSDLDYPAACHAVAEAFGLTPAAPPIIVLDLMFWDFQRAEQSISMNWDNWLGFMIVANTEESEPLVRAIAAWFQLNPWVSTESQV